MIPAHLSRMFTYVCGDDALQGIDKLQAEGLRGHGIKIGIIGEFHLRFDKPIDRWC
jgi:hypothetical protein